MEKPPLPSTPSKQASLKRTAAAGGGPPSQRQCLQMTATVSPGQTDALLTPTADAAATSSLKTSQPTPTEPRKDTYTSTADAVVQQDIPTVQLHQPLRSERDAVEPATSSHVASAPSTNTIDPVVATQEPPVSSSTLIKDLSTDTDGWTIIGRVVSRTAIRTWHSVRGDGKVFDFVIIDHLGFTIKAAVFNEGVDLFSDLVQNAVTCAFSGGKVKRAVQAFSAHPYELVFDHRASIVLMPEDNSPRNLAITLTTIKDLHLAPRGSKVSVLAIVSFVERVKRFQHSSGETRVKRDILLVDDSMSKVVCTLWGFQARIDFDQYLGKPVVVRFGTLNDFNGLRSISALPGCSLLFDPALDAAETMRTWYATMPDKNEFLFVTTPST